MKNEPIVAYDHLQDEEIKESHMMHISHSGGKRDWRMFINPFAIAIEITAALALAIYMIVELFH